jgi:hypothetical protein
MPRRYCPEKPQNDVAEQFLVMPYGNSLAGQALAPGAKVIVKSLASGKFCQVILVEQKNHIICNLTSSEFATPLEFTGGQRHWLCWSCAANCTYFRMSCMRACCHEPSLCSRGSPRSAGLS